MTETATRWNLYDGLTGSLFRAFGAPPDLGDVQLGLSLAPRTPPRRLERDINEAIKKARSVVTQKAQQRHAARVEALGVPADTEHAEVTASEVVYLPFYCALLRNGRAQRVAAIDAAWGTESQRVEQSITANVTYVTSIAGDAPGPESAEFLARRHSARQRGLLTFAFVAAVVVEYAATSTTPSVFLLLLAATVVLFVLIGLRLRQPHEESET